MNLLAVQGTLKSLLQHHSSKAWILWCSAFLTVQLSHPYMTTGKTIALTRWTFVGKVMSLLFNMLSRLVITLLPRSKHLLISWLQSPSAVILEPPKNKVWHCFHCFPIYFPWSDGTKCHDLSFRAISSHLFFSFWLHWVFVALHGLSLVAVSRVYSLLMLGGFSCWGAQALGHVGFSSGFSSAGLSCSEENNKVVGSSWTRGQTHVPLVGRRILIHYATRQVLLRFISLCWTLYSARPATLLIGQFSFQKRQGG